MGSHGSLGTGQDRAAAAHLFAGCNLPDESEWNASCACERTPVIAVFRRASYERIKIVLVRKPMSRGRITWRIYMGSNLADEFWKAHNAAVVRYYNKLFFAWQKFSRPF